MIRFLIIFYKLLTGNPLMCAFSSPKCHWEQRRSDGMNEFFNDATYNFNRCAKLLKEGMAKGEIEDALMQFAFGVERVFKGIVFDVNPLFVMENGSFENALGVLYRDKLIEPHRSNTEKTANSKEGFNTQYLAFKGSMLRAAKFSKAVEDSIGAFLKLSDMRGVVAHRPMSRLNHAAANRFLLKLFMPTVSNFAAEERIVLANCIKDARPDLAEITKRVIDTDKLRERMDALFEGHRAEWEKISDKPDLVARIKRETDEIYRYRNSERHADEYQCPACDNMGIVYIEADWDVEGSGGVPFMTGVYVSGFECKFCGLELTDPEEFDYLRLNEWLARDE